MTLYLRDADNKTVLDVEVYVKKEELSEYIELHSSVIISEYSLLLLSEQDRAKQIQMIMDFDELSELRGWLWEKYFMGRQNNPSEYSKVVDELRKMLKIIGNRYGLYIVED